MDEQMKPYAEFLEAICKACAENQPDSCAFVYETKDDIIGTGYFGEATGDVFDKCKLAFAIQQDALMETVLANADKIRDRAEEIEGENADQ